LQIKKNMKNKIFIFLQKTLWFSGIVLLIASGIGEILMTVWLKYLLWDTPRNEYNRELDIILSSPVSYWPALIIFLVLCVGTMNLFLSLMFERRIARLA